MTEKILAVQQMQDYIAGHLSEKITLCDLSCIAGYSPFYCARIFKELTGLTPADYIRRLRLSGSALRLRDEQCKVIDIAYDSGYDGVDGYQRAFRNTFGCNPYEYAKSPIPLPLFIPYGVKFKTLWKKQKSMEHIANVFIQVVEKPECKVIIKREKMAQDYWSYCQEVGCDVWGILTSMKSLCGEPVCMWLPEKYREASTSEYVQGVEVTMDYTGIIPDEFDVITLPAAKYLMFQGGQGRILLQKGEGDDMKEREEKKQWVLCPWCGSKTRLQIFRETELKDSPLFCPKCRHESIINARNFTIETKEARR